MKRVHEHVFEKGRSNNVEICQCGKFRFTNTDDAIVEVPVQTMNETKHTQGPWKRGHHAHYNQIQIYTTHFYHPLAEVKGDDMQANARLIAAAPDLLEALKNYLAISSDWFVAISERYGVLSTEIDKYQQMRDEARAAIAKATA
jgi:hypothetical protein